MSRSVTLCPCARRLTTLCLLLGTLSANAMGTSPLRAATPDAPTQNMLSARATAIMTVDLGIPPDQLPSLLFSTRSPSAGGGSESIARFYRPGESYPGLAFEQPTVVIFSGAQASTNCFDVAIRHEALHYLATSNPPPGLQRLWNTYEERAKDAFVFPDVPERAILLENFIVDVRQLLEEKYIAEDGAQYARTHDYTPDAQLLAEDALTIRSKNWDDFLNSDHDITINNRTFSLKRRQDSKHDGSSSITSNIAKHANGDVAGQYDEGSTGTNTTTSPRPGGGVNTHTIATGPVVIEQDGNCITMTRAIVTKAEGSDGSVMNASTHSQCSCILNANILSCNCTTVATNSGILVMNLPLPGGGTSRHEEIVPEERSTTTGQVELTVLKNGDLRSATGTVFRRIK